MWQTPSGTRVLLANEARLFRALAGHMQSALGEAIAHCLMEDAEPITTGQDAYDNLTPAQQFVVLAEVVEGLLDEAVPARPLTAVHEACIQAIFEQFHSYFDEGQAVSTIGPLPASMEAVGRRVRLEEMRLNFLNAARDAGMAGLPELSEPNPEAWFGLADQLADRILHDRDFELVDLTDAAPDDATRIRTLARIDPAYFGHVPADPATKSELATFWNRINRVLGTQSQM